MTQINLGDRVKVINSPYGDSGIRTGQFGYVHKDEGNGQIWCLAETPNPGDPGTSWPFYEDEVELAPPYPYKVGDRVEAITNHYTGNGIRKGQFGYVLEIIPNHGICVRAEKPNPGFKPGDYKWFFKNNMVRPAPVAKLINRPLKDYKLSVYKDEILKLETTHEVDVNSKLAELSRTLFKDNLTGGSIYDTVNAIYRESYLRQTEKP
jgi:hypothetical protein